MSKSVDVTPLVVLGSARKQSDTQAFIEQVFGDTVYQLVDLLDVLIYPYNYSEQYPADDAFAQVVDELLRHEVIVFATPVYWYAMSGPMKIFFDRLTELTTVYKSSGRQLRGKRVLLLSSGSDEFLPPGFEVPFELTANYFGMSYAGSIYGSIKHPLPTPSLLAAIDLFKSKLHLTTS
jgi:putative NADPH-quinone reductase